MENKNSIPVLGIPVLNRGDLLLRCFNSIDYPVDELYIVFNHTGVPDASVQSAIEEIEHSVLQSQSQVKHVTVFRPEGPLTNLGCSGSWNHMMAATASAPYWMIVGNDIKFTEGDLQKMNEAAIKDGDTHAMFWANHGFSFFIITQLALQKVGIFDGNIYPSYTEDCDFSYRMELIDIPRKNVQDIHAIHGEAPTWGSSTIYSNEYYRRINGVTHGRNFEYYKRKWGGINGEEKYKYPFNDPSLPVTYWPQPTEYVVW